MSLETIIDLFSSAYPFCFTVILKNSILLKPVRKSASCQNVREQRNGNHPMTCDIYSGFCTNKNANHSPFNIQVIKALSPAHIDS